MPSPRTKPSLTSLVAFFLIVMLYAASYFMVVRIDHSATTGIAGAVHHARDGYGGKQQPVSSHPVKIIEIVVVEDGQLSVRLRPPEGISSDRIVSGQIQGHLTDLIAQPGGSADVSGPGILLVKGLLSLND